MYPLIIKREILLPAAIIAFFIFVIGAFCKMTHVQFLGFSPNLVLGIGWGILLFVWFIVIIDAVRNGVKNPFMWIVAFAFFGSIASIIYLYYRNTIIIKKENKLH